MDVPTTDDAAALRATAEQVARAAAQHLSTMPPPRTAAGEGVPGAVRTKTSPTDVVTAADEAVEALVREQLARLRPGSP